ncbi:rhodopsin, GQ-coupled-like [Palaemon carinicauda]|uniref:rhodopsin, GQ-coupled-like n=1 Tax=Palaemon carinicauda TaxID=392227 RepID=UPI0035B59D53
MQPFLVHSKTKDSDKLFQRLVLASFHHRADQCGLMMIHAPLHYQKWHIIEGTHYTGTSVKLSAIRGMQVYGACRDTPQLSLKRNDLAINASYTSSSPTSSHPSLGTETTISTAETLAKDDQLFADTYQDLTGEYWNNSERFIAEYNLSWARDLGVPPEWLINHARANIPGELHLVVAFILSAIGLLGTAGNAVVLWVFTRFRRLRSPANTFIVNLSASDLITSVLHSMAAYSSFQHRWAFGRLGCSLYGGGVGLLGLVSIVTLTLIAVERFIVIRTSSATSKWRINRRTARKIIFLIWIYCAALSLPPFFGWSSYIPEGLLTSCSWDYISQEPSNRAYYIYLLVGGFVIPVGGIILCYSYILFALFKHSRILVSRALPRSAPARRNDLRTAQMVLTLILLFIISWSPYATVSLIGQFGDVRVLTPWVTTLPALFAKASVIYNPIVYGMSHPHFRSSLQHLFSSVATTQQQMHYKHSTAGPRHVSVNSVIALPVDSPRRHWHSDATGIAGGRGDSMIAGLSMEESFSYLTSPDIMNLAKGDNANLSEPDLLRHDDRIIPAHLVTFVSYHREKRRFLRSALFCSESSLERYDRRQQRNIRQTYLGGGGGLMPTTAPNCVLEQTGPDTWDHVALLAPSLPLRRDSGNSSVGTASPGPYRRTSFSTNCSRSPRLSMSRINGSKPHRHSNCCQCAAGDLAQTITVATMNNRRRSSTIHVCLRGNLHQYMDV